MSEGAKWQALLQGLYPGISVSAAVDLRDWSQSRVVRLTGTLADGSPVTLYAKHDRSGRDIETLVYRAAARVPGFPAPAAGFVREPDGAEWLLISAARGNRLADLSAEAWPAACRGLATFHELAGRAGWAAGVTGLRELTVSLADLPWSVIADTRRCMRKGIYAGLCGGALSDVETRLQGAWQGLAANVAAYPVALMHGDSHSGNLFLSSDGTIELIDWAAAQAGPGLLDLVGLLDTAARMHEDCPAAAAVAAYRNALSDDSRRRYGDFDQALATLSIVRALTELEWFAASDDDYGERANCELAKIEAALDRL